MKKFIIILLVLSSTIIFSQNENNSRFYNKLAFQAYYAHNYKDFLKNMKRAYELSNTHQSYIYNLAIAYLFNDQKKEALQILKKGLSFGFVYPLDKDEDLKDLINDPEFKSLSEQNLANQQAMEISRTVAKLPAKQVIAEGLALNNVDSTFFISSIYKGIIYNVDKENKILWQSDDENFGSVAGLKIDYNKKLLWGTFVYQPQSKNFIDSLNGNSGIFCYDLGAKEKLLKTTLAKDSLEKHWLGDLILDSVGNVYASDSYAGKIYKFSSPDFKPQIFLSDTNFISLQGLTFTDDERYIIFADYSRGLFLYDNKTSKVKEIRNLTNNTLLGIDGIYFYKDNQIIAIQNGINPQRVVEITLDENYAQAIDLRVLEANNHDYEEITLGTITNNYFYFIANSQWNKFSRNGEIFDAGKFNDVIIKTIKLN